VLEPEEELAEEMNRVQPLRDEFAPAAVAAQPLAETQRRQREDTPDRNGDRPRHRQPARGAMHVVDQQENRHDARGRRQQGVLERAEAEHADPRLTRVDELLTEGVKVEREASAGNEDAEAGGNERERTRVRERRAAVHACHLTVGEHVTEIREHFRAQRERKPAGVAMTEAVGDRAEASRPRDADQGRCGQPGPEHDERDHLARGSFEVRAVSERAGNPHEAGIGTKTRRETPQSVHGGFIRAGDLRSDGHRERQ